MLRIIKVTDSEGMKSVKNFNGELICIKCGCNKPEDLYIMNKTKPKCADPTKYNNQWDDYTVCYCIECLPYNINNN